MTEANISIVDLPFSRASSLSSQMKCCPKIRWVGLFILSFATHAASLTDLGILPGYDSSTANAISADGKTVVGDCSRFDGQKIIAEPFIWTAAQGIVGMGWMPDCTNCTATSVSTNGIVVGHCDTENSVRAFKWTAQYGYTQLANDFSSSQTHATAISANGEVIVGYFGNGTAVKWNTENQFTYLSGSFGAWRPRDVSGDGSAIVGIAGYVGTYDPRAVRWRAGENAEYLDTVANLPSGLTLLTANAVTLDGQFIGGLCGTAPRAGKAYIWSAANGLKLFDMLTGPSAEVQPLAKKGEVAATPGPDYTEAEAVAEGGLALVGNYFPTLGPLSFIWTAETGSESIKQALDYLKIFDPLVDTRYGEGSTTDISADGTMIVGSLRRRLPVDTYSAYLLDIRNIQIVQTTSALQLTWPSGFKLQQTTDLDFNTWHDVPAAISPFTISTTGPGSFYRIIRLP
jgi:uncharacterized membrane protein